MMLAAATIVSRHWVNKPCVTKRSCSNAWSTLHAMHLCLTETAGCVLLKFPVARPYMRLHRPGILPRDRLGG
jgi:hypothetical protein